MTVLHRGTLRSLARLCLIVLMLCAGTAFLSGCGGKNSDNGQVNTVLGRALNVTVTWAQRSTNRAALAPASALSAKGRIPGAAVDGGNITFTLNRRTEPAAYTQAYQVADQYRTGPFVLFLEFYSLPDGGGVLVGTATIPINLDANTTDLVPLTVPSQTTVRRVEIQAGQTVVVDQQKDLIFTAFDDQNNVLALSPGAAQYNVVTGLDRLFFVNGQMRGLAAGTAQVQVTVDGVASNTVDVVVTAPTQSTTDVSDLVAAGRSAINDITLGNVQPSASSLFNAFRVFEDAFTQNPNDTQARFGYAITSIAYRAQVIADNAVGRSTKTGRAETAEGSETLLQGTRFWESQMVGRVNRAVVDTATLPLTVAKLSGKTRLVDDPRLRANLENLKTQLDVVLPLMESTAGQTSFSFPIAVRENGGAVTKSLDQGDAQAILSGFYLARAAVSVLLAHNTDTNGFDFEETFGEKFRTQIVNQATLTQNDLLPTGFLTLRGDASTRFTEALADLRTAVDRVDVALNTMQARSSQNTRLIVVTDFTQARDGATRARNALNGTVQETLTSNGTDHQVTLNIPGYFGNPVAVRGFVPNVRFTRRETSFEGNEITFTTYIFEMETNASDYPDRSYGGLLSGLPDDAFVSKNEVGRIFSSSAQPVSPTDASNLELSELGANDVLAVVMQVLFPS